MRRQGTQVPAESIYIKGHTLDIDYEMKIN